MENIYNYIASLEDLTVPELHQLWKEYFHKPTNAINKSYLINIIAYKIQEDKYGGLSDETKFQLNKNIKENNKRITKLETKKTIKPGTELVKIYKNNEFRVTVINEGFEFNGLIYKSLTKIANIITGQKISGPRFFELNKGA
jgi:hypothetical protein